MLAGVSGAIGRATNTDPVLWRVIFAVLSVFGGVGAIAYLLGWLLLPADGDTASPIEALVGRGRSGTSATLTVIGGVIVLLTAGSFLSDPFQPGLLGALLVAAAVLLVLRDQRHRSNITRTPPPGGFGPGMPPSPGPFAPHGPFAPPVPPATDPYTSSGFYPPPPPPPAGGAPPPPPVWIPPAPPGPPAPGAAGPHQHPRRAHRPRSRLGRLTLSVVLISIGLLAMAEMSGHELPTATYLAVALGVVGAGLVVGAWVGRGRGMIALGIGLVLLLGAAGTAEKFDDNLHGAGSISWAPQSISELGSSYRHNAGDAVLDLSDVDFRGQNRTIDAQIKFGDFEIILPADVDVTIDTNVGMGNVTLFGETIGGLRPSNRSIVDNGDDGPGGGSLTIRASVHMSNLEVHR